MRALPILIALGAAVPLGAAVAQPVTQETVTVETRTVSTPPVEQVPSSAAVPGAVPGPDGVVRQWGPQAAIVESAPPPAASYPPCTRALQDSCTNPDPSKELNYYPADKAAG